MLFRFDERALALIQGQIVKDLAAWGSYPIFLSVFYKLFDWLRILDFRLELMFWINHLFSILAFYFLFKDKLSSKKNSHLFFCLLTIFLINPLFIYFTSMNMSESFFVFTSVMLIISLHHYEKTNKVGIVALAGVLLAIAVSLRSMIIPFALCLIIYGFVKHKGKQQKFSFFVPLLASFLSFYLLLGEFVSRHDHLSRRDLSLNRGPNIAQTWCEAQIIETETSGGTFWFRPPAYRYGDETQGLFLDQPFENTSFYSKLGLECLKESPELLFLRLRSVLNTFNGPIYPDPLNLVNSNPRLITFFQFLQVAAFVLFSISILLRLRDSVKDLKVLFILSSLGAVYIGNIGESRFLMSFYPFFAFISLLSLQEFSNMTFLKRFWIGVGVSISAYLISEIPSTLEIQNVKKERYFHQVNINEFRKDLSLRLSYLQSNFEVCQDFQKILGELESSPKIKNAILEYLVNFNKKPRSELEFFCRNLLMVELRNRKLYQTNSSELGAISPLNESLASSHPIEAIAGRLLYYDLLISSSEEHKIPESEKYYELIKNLFRYQHRLKWNRAEYLGKVVDYPIIAKPSEQAEVIYRETLQTLLESLSYYEERQIPFDRLKLL